MKTLETIQKAFRVFQTIAKIIHMLCIVGAVMCGVGALCAITQYLGGQVFGITGEPLTLFSDATALPQMYVRLLAAAFMLAAEAVLFGISCGYLKVELADGTPFTVQGANRLRKLGIRFIYIPIIAISLSEAIAVWQGVESIGKADIFGSVTTGIVLILVSLIFRYGAELEQKNQEQSAKLRKMYLKE